MWWQFEKLVGTHHKPLWIRLPSRIPVTGILFFIASKQHFPTQSVSVIVHLRMNAMLVVLIIPAMKWE